MSFAVGGKFRASLVPSLGGLALDCHPNGVIDGLI